MDRLKMESNRGVDGLLAGDEPVFVFDGGMRGKRKKKGGERPERFSNWDYWGYAAVEYSKVKV